VQEKKQQAAENEQERLSKEAAAKPSKKTMVHRTGISN
jgi:hypothetical protein